jgi:polyhydroxyalkanoate synthase
VSSTPRSKGKRSHWVGPNQFPADPQAWLASAQEVPGSWWTPWSQWLSSQAGTMQPAPRAQGSRKHRPVEPAPGRYVKQKA